MKKELTWEEYNEMLGHVKPGFRLVSTTSGKYYLVTEEIHSFFTIKKEKKKKK